MKADAERALLLALLDGKREPVARLPSEHPIVDQVTRRMQTIFDSDEVRLIDVKPDE